MKANEPAFPINDENCSVRERAESPGFMQGLTKLEYFAGLAMQGIIASDINDRLTLESTVSAAVKAAKALIAELEKQS